MSIYKIKDGQDKICALVSTIKNCDCEITSKAEEYAPVQMAVNPHTIKQISRHVANFHVK